MSGHVDLEADRLIVVSGLSPLAAGVRPRASRLASLLVMADSSGLMSK